MCLRDVVGYNTQSTVIISYYIFNAVNVDLFTPLVDTVLALCDYELHNPPPATSAARSPGTTPS